MSPTQDKGDTQNPSANRAEDALANIVDAVHVGMLNLECADDVISTRFYIKNRVIYTSIYCEAIIHVSTKHKHYKELDSYPCC